MDRGFLVKLLLVLVALLAAPYLLRLVKLKPSVEGEVRSFEGQPLGIKQIVRQVKQELYEAELEGIAAGEMPLFKVDHFDLELNFVVADRSKASAGAAPQLIVVDKETELSSQKIQKIHLHWKANSEIEGKKEQQEFGTTGAVPLGSRPPGTEEAVHAPQEDQR